MLQTAAKQVIGRKCGFGYLLGVGVFAFIAGGVQADILVETNGNICSGKIVSQDASEVVFEPDDALLRQARTISRESLVSAIVADKYGSAAPESRKIENPIERWNLPSEPTAPPLETQPASGPKYYVIPLRGSVGEEILASILEKSLADAETRRPDVVILEIDSPGGFVPEAERMMGVLHRYNTRMRIVALVGQDLSAAAVFSLSAREIFVRPGATIGAATAYQRKNLWVPEVLDEKRQSAWRAVARGSAQEGRHEPILAEAMIDGNVELHLETVDGKSVAREGHGANPIKRKGTVLTLTAQEALACGLAAGEAEDYAAIGAALGMPGWTECKGLGPLLAEHMRKKLEAMNVEMERIHSKFVQNTQTASLSDPAAMRIRFSDASAQQQFRPKFRQVIIESPELPTRERRIREQYYDPPRKSAIRSNDEKARISSQIHKAQDYDLPGKRQAWIVEDDTAPVASIQRKSPLEEGGIWKKRSLYAVISLQRAEENLREAIELCEACGQEGTARMLKGLQAPLKAQRGRIYVDRLKPYGIEKPDVSDAPKSVEEAKNLLKGTNASDQAHAAICLAQAKPDASNRQEVLALLESCLDDPNARRRAAFVRAYGRWAEREQVPRLVQMLQTPKGRPDGDDLVWAAALVALMRLDPAAAESVILERRGELWFRLTVDSALEDYAGGTSMEAAEARHLMAVARGK